MKVHHNTANLDEARRQDKKELPTLEHDVIVWRRQSETEVRMHLNLLSKLTTNKVSRIRE